MTAIKWSPINAEESGTSIPLVGKVGGTAIGAIAIVADVELPQVTSYFRIGDTASGHNFILEGADGNAVSFPNVLTGEVISFATKKILLTDGALITDAVNVTWIGGI